MDGHDRRLDGARAADDAARPAEMATMAVRAWSAWLGRHRPAERGGEAGPVRPAAPDRSPPFP